MKIKRNGFTLIELLVVISIIALLVGILLPALGAARRSAQNMQCLSNLRQIGIGVWAYSFDSEDQLPPSWVGGGAPGWDASGTEWPIIINAYITGSSDTDYDAGSEDQHTEAFKCPSAEFQISRLDYSASRLMYPLMQAAWPEGSANYLPLYKTGSALRTSEVLMIGDGLQSLHVNASVDEEEQDRAYAALDKIDAGRATNKTHYYDPNYFGNDLPISNPHPSITGGQFDYRHPGGSDGSVNLVYVDGHAGNVSKDNVTARIVRADRPPGL